MSELLSSIWSIPIVIFAFSILIFIHELGHYLAAIAVGVRPERFFVGFDIYGLAISKEYKGCVYGIGILPLGGYCKLTGQSDDPREQKRNAAKGYKSYDYNAKPLWARALIISAGVIMNMIFGFLLLMYGYMQGVPTSPAVAGIVIENTAASNADIKSGDKILEINNTPMPDFGKIKETFVMNPGSVFNLKIERNGKTIARRVMGNQGPDGLNQIGLMPAISTTVLLDSSPVPFTGEGYDNPLQDGDIITRINGEDLSPVLTSGYRVYEIINSTPGRNAKLEIKRGEEIIEVEMPVLGTGTYDFGYRVSIDIKEVMPDSPAEEAGLKSGDIITSIEVAGVDYPLLSSSSFIEAVKSQSFLPVEVDFMRDGKKLTKTIKPKFMSWNTAIDRDQDSFLGVGVEDNKVINVLNPDSPLKTGDEIIAINGERVDLGESIRSIVAKASTAPIVVNTIREQGLKIRPAISLDTATAQIGIIMDPLAKIHKVIKGSKASVFLTPGSVITNIVLSPNLKKTAVSWLNRSQQPQEPFIFDTPAEIASGQETASISGYLPFGLNVAKVKQPVTSYSKAATLAFNKSIDMSKTIYQLLHRLIVNDISAEAISGPIGIFRIMKSAAEGDDGFMKIISLLALLSINLAVVNLLPFPVLDGGHLVFIIYEWITRRPPSERFRIASQYFGAICLFSLMIYVTFNDVIKWISGS